MSPSFVPPSRGVLDDCVRLATTAPSLHNSQPWKFRVTPPEVEVYADPGRHLPVIDPAGREHLISVGAAVFTLRLAMRRAGYDVRCDLLPDPADPALAARVTAGRVTPVDQLTEQLAAAIPHRHTNRSPFADVAVPAGAVDRLRSAARREGATLTVAGPVARDAILGLARAADRRLRERPHYADELRRWTGQNARHDGVPVWAAAPWDALEIMPMRDFVPVGPGPRPREPFEPHPTIMVLATAGDTRADWLRAGMALQRVLLTATWLGLATTPISQPVEVAAVRSVLGRTPAQMVLRVGYGRVSGRTPRRPLSEVLLPAGPSRVTATGNGDERP
ncbi:nitroreductase family protein [Actinoplanes sp. L3-i22]|uniref:Acg family FMN-binding oxidoreductase n=1 Tax=Actinoplanes sp. L3-i22 TaxID=2836373 RepID=UPI001C782FE2|nr:nitroreductase family protein [Actinoplanes sp. L3-i22]BCY09998.1 NAD(P)H nitroreductase [Actinoplanes sp. L3-i22]